MTRSPGERAESPLTASVVSGPGSLGRPPVMADVARLAGVSHQNGVAGPQRPSERSPSDEGQGARRHPRARLPAERRRPDPGHTENPHAGRDQLRHHAVRAGLHAVRLRASGARQLLRVRRQPARAGPPVDAGRGGPVPRPGRRGHHRDRDAGHRGGRACARARQGAAGRRGLRHEGGGDLRRDRQRGRRLRRDPVPAQPRAPDRLPRRRAFGPPRRAGTRGRLAAGAGRGRRAGTGPAGRRLVGLLRL